MDWVVFRFLLPDWICLLLVVRDVAGTNTESWSVVVIIEGFSPVLYPEETEGVTLALWRGCTVTLLVSECCLLWLTWSLLGECERVACGCRWACVHVIALVGWWLTSSCGLKVCESSDPQLSVRRSWVSVSVLATEVNRLAWLLLPFSLTFPARWCERDRGGGAAAAAEVYR